MFIQHFPGALPQALTFRAFGAESLTRRTAMVVFLQILRLSVEEMLWRFALRKNDKEGNKYNEHGYSEP